MPRVLAFLALLSLGLWIPSRAVQAETFSYVDGSGNLHMTDSLQTVPPEYRATTDVRPEPGDADSLQASLDQRRKASSRMILASIRQIRKSNGMGALSHRQKREFNAFMRTWLPLNLAACVILTLVWILAVIHGFNHDHRRWAMINLGLAVTVPVYAWLYMGQKQPALKLLFVAGSTLPVLILVKTTYDLTLMMMGLLA